MALRIETTFTTDSRELKSPFSPSTPTVRDRTISISHGLIPTIRRGHSEKSPLIPSNSEKLHGSVKAQGESKKLLSTALGRLLARQKPPPQFSEKHNRSESRSGLSAAMRSLSGRGRTGDGQPEDERRSKTAVKEDTDDEGVDDAAFYTDETCDLMFQLRDVLKISLLHGWDVFSPEDSPDPNVTRKDSTEKRWRRKRSNSNSQSMLGSRSRSRSPTRDIAIEAVELFEDCITVLTSIIEEDCRFQIRHPRPVRPPNALQAVTLDVAQLILYTRRYDPRSIARVGFAVLPAFKTFKPGLHTRVLAFFDEGVIAWMLFYLEKLQGRSISQNMMTDQEEPPNTSGPIAITVDEVSDDPSLQGEKWQRWRKIGVDDTGLQSTNAPNQDVSAYQLTSLVQPLLGTIFEHVDILTPNTPTTQRFHKFFRHLRQRKPDVYLDLLGVVAYHVPKVRSVAVNMLSAYWPKALGHAVISRPISAHTSSLKRNRSDRQSSFSQRPNLLNDHPYDHQFVPWKFSISPNPVLFEAFAPNYCKVCYQAIEGFGMLCPFCLCAVHFDCFDYPEGSFLTEYSMEPGHEIRKVAVHRFCHVLPQSHGKTDHIVRKEQHVFRTVNIFGMCLCYVCHKPLWGYMTQGMKCGICHHFVHAFCLTNDRPDNLSRCRSAAVDSSSVTIPYSLLRSTFVDHYRGMLLTEPELAERTYEELTVFYSVLWTQLQILENGIALGSIIITKNGQEDEHALQGFELHYVVKLLEAYLQSTPPPVSESLQDYLSENRMHAPNTSFFFDWNMLAFIASIVKLPHPTPSATDFESSELLSVSPAGSRVDVDSDELIHPYEVASLAHFRDRLGESLQINLDRAAQLLLSHLHHLGFLDRCDSVNLVIDGEAASREVQCCFPLPFGLDISADVETLVAAIEGSLSDIDLSINEVGFLLLVRRFWPNGMLSNYTFRRLAKAILQWILSEDTNLAVILRDYVARGRILPGVRSGEPHAWPFQVQYRPSATPVASNGGDYVASRRALLARYAAPWMLALHDIDIVAYAHMLFELLCEHAEEGTYHDSFFMGPENTKTPRGKNIIEDVVLKLMVKLSQASIAFSVFDDLFEYWLSRMQIYGNYDEPVQSLPRLFTREDGTQRQSIVTDARNSMGDLTALASINPLHKLMQISLSSADGFQRGLAWLSLFACSGVDIPLTVFRDLAAAASKFQANLRDCSTLVKACLYSSWLRSIGRQDMQVTVAVLFAYLEPHVLSNIHAREATAETLSFIRSSIAVCLLLYGCEREYLLSQNLIMQEEIDSLPSRRKTGARASAVTDPVIIDPRIMTTLKSLLDQELDEVSLLVVHFLYAFVCEASLVESYEADNFILRNSVTLCSCVWEAYAIQAPVICLIRATLFVRVLAVDAQPFQALMESLFKDDTSWEIRLQSASRLFRIILDITSPACNIEDRQWRPSVTDVFYFFFSLIWNDKREEIRVAADAWAQSLLPAHLQAIAQCWNEALGKASMPERVKVVNFLSQLHSHFPKWKVLTWEAIIEALLENDFLQKDGDDGLTSAHLSFYGLSSMDAEDISPIADPEHVLLSVSLVSLSLRMMADGIEVDIFSLLRIKDQLLRVLGFEEVSLVPSASGHTFHIQFGEIRTVSRWADPCIADMMSVFDSAQTYDVSCSVMGGLYAEDDSSVTLLIGSPFIDILLGIFRHAHRLTFLAPLTLKNLLKCLIIVIQKHDFDSKPLKHLQGNLRESVRRALFLLMDKETLSQELRQLALTVIQVFTKRWPSIMGAYVFEAIEGTSRLLLSLSYKQRSDDPLVVQGRVFMESILHTFYSRGVLHALFKKQLDDEFFHVLQFVLESVSKTVLVTPTNGSLPDVLLHDTLSRALSGDLGSPFLLFTNINKFVELVHHSRYTADLLQFVGSSLNSIAQRVADSSSDLVDMSPLLSLSATLIQHNKVQSRDFLPHVETLMRIVLSRASVNSQSISRVLQMTCSLYRKIESREQAFLANHVAVTILQTITEALCGKLRLLPSTLAASAEAIMNNVGPVGIPPQRFVQLAQDGIQYLHSYSSASPLYQDFAACQSVAKMVLHAASEQPQLLAMLAHNGLDLRTWNLVLLAAVRDGKGCAKHVFPHFRTFTRVYYSTFNRTDVDISRAYVAVKLWLLLARQLPTSDEDDFNTTGEQNDHESITSTMIWNELWPSLEAVVSSLEQEGAAPNVVILASSSVADLILFVHQSHTVISLELAPHIALLKRLKRTNRVALKIDRVLRAVVEPLVQVSVDTYISQIAAEIEAEEKLEIAKWQESTRPVPERIRRIVS